MQWRRSDFDVTNLVNVTVPGEVCTEVCRLFSELYPSGELWRIEKAFDDVTALFLGEFPGYYRCETPYHDLQHTLDVTLAMTRLLYGHEQQNDTPDLGEAYFQLGIFVALFHDAGYMRRPEDKLLHGAAYTFHHVSRSALFLHSYLPSLGMGELAPLAGRIVHYTGYEMQIDDIPVHSEAERTLGHLVGTADLLAQMADRCYLEKCRDRLYYEFAIAGIAGVSDKQPRFRSPDDLLLQTTSFIEHAFRDRLDSALGAAHRYSKLFFLPGSDLYRESIQNNIDYMSSATENHELPLLRRNPPWTLNLAPNELENFPFIS